MNPETGSKFGAKTLFHFDIKVIMALFHFGTKFWLRIEFKI
ncbi:hypothetical protein K788_00002105 [Paraburkholderia caribensis MBA4]|uniref:Uncharacterized protein n=1 Tax=Paraburkholderia caribensis MBA4 TaxID=1323664 RepID=A0A0P0RIW4_9BURK|nr:hypothetical protein K788_00002105 [Paraburkholderia caribensis MBA4]